MTQSTPTCLWNDSASVQELTYSIEHGAVGATCNPVIVLGVLKNEIDDWKDRIQSLIEELPTATEDEIAWQLVREISVKAAALLKPIFDEQHGKNGRLSIQTDPAIVSRHAGDRRAGGRIQQARAQHDREDSGHAAREFRRSRKRRIAASASMRPCASLCRNALPSPKRSSAV